MASPPRAWLTPDDLPPTTICRRLSIPDTPLFRIAVTGCLMLMTEPENWEQFGAITPEETAAAAAVMLADFEAAQGYCMIGSIVAIATAQVPENMILCDGTVYDNVDYPEFNAVRSSALNVGLSQFKTPDLRGRFILAPSGGITEHSIGGVDEVTLDESQLPAHTHIQNAHTHFSPGHNHSQAPHQHTYNYPVINIDIEAPGVPDPLALGNPGLPALTSAAGSPIGFTAATINQSTATNQSTGGNQPHENMPPYYALRYAIIVR